MESNMSNYIFAICEAGGQIMAVIAEGSDFRSNGGVSDEHISQGCGGSMPDILGWDEAMESFFLPWNEMMVASEAHDDLLSKGLAFDAELADWAAEEGDGTVFRPGK